MLGGRFLSFFTSAGKTGSESEGASIARKAVSFMLITVTGGVALSALDDLLIYNGCTRRAIERANNDLAVKDAIGAPITKGPWYNASIAVTHQRHTVSCTFPVSGPRGNGIIQLKAIRNGDDNFLSLIHSRDWEIVVMEALLHVPENDGKDQTLRITVSDNVTPSTPTSRNVQTD